MVEPGVQKQPFADVLQNRCLENIARFIGKHLCWSQFKVAHMLSYDLCKIFKNTYFSIAPQNQTTLLSKQNSKVT